MKLKEFLSIHETISKFKLLIEDKHFIKIRRFFDRYWPLSFSALRKVYKLVLKQNSSFTTEIYFLSKTTN